MRRFIAFSATLFLVILVVSSGAFLFSMRQITRINKGNKLTQHLEIVQVKLESSVNSEIELVTKMAKSPLIMRFFSDPQNPALKTIAQEEISAYCKTFKESKFFWVNDIDKIFYMDDAESYVLDPQLPANYWYNMTLYETDTYNFNINYNPDLNVTNLWVNVPVLDWHGKPIGMMGVGIDITVFINDLYRKHEGATLFYLFNSAGEITGAKNVEQVIAKEFIEDEFGMPDKLLALAKSLRPNETRPFDSPLGRAAIGTVPALEWYSVAVMPDSIDDYMNPITAVFIAMLAVIALITIIFNIFVANFLVALKKTMYSLETTSRYKSEFLARMSHEIRTPMNAILGMSEIALREQNVEHVHEIKRAGTSLLSIINNILDFSKIESGKLEIIPTDYLFSTLIDNVSCIIKARALEACLEFKVDIDNQLPKAFFGDETRIRQIILNLLGNAVKFTSKGFVSLSVRGIKLSADTIRLTIKVVDSGKGIKEGDIARLFRDFEQLSQVANKDIEGTGLGLAITQSLVEAMGGHITVESEYGKGSTFTVTLLQKVSHKETFDAGKDALTFKAPSAKVLVVDDTPINLVVAKRLLALCEIQVHTCTSGEAAVAAVQAEEYDLVFMDHMMPGMDGIEATATIRSLEGEHFQTLPIVALTANAIVGMEEMYLQHGFNDYLSKPIDIQKLNSILEKWIPAKKQNKSDDHKTTEPQS